MSDWPALTIVMPVRNEGPFMARSLDAVLAQDYPGRLEVLVADGASTDETTSVVSARSAADARVRLVSNPDRIVPGGLNRALALATGELIMRVDGHCEIEPDYARTCVARLVQDDVACVGGVLRTVGTSVMARAVARAQASFVGVGNAAFRTGASTAREVDTVAFGVYRRDLLVALGAFDQDLVRNQDDELNLRVIQDGGRIVLDPSVSVVYHSRATLPDVARQYLQYGWFKPLVLRKRGRLPSLRSAMPALVVVGLILTVVLGVATGRPLVAVVPTGAYLVGLVATGVWIGRRDLRAAPLVPLALAALHLPYGAGFLAGLWHWRRAPATPVRPDHG